MLIFIETEFTDFVDMELISIALVSADGRQFYRELKHFRREKCSDFVKQVVLSLLGRDLKAVVTREQMRADLLIFLAQFATKGGCIGYDYFGDYALLQEALGGPNGIPRWPSSTNIRSRIDEALYLQYFRDTGLPQHHALYDAMANRFAYRSPA